MQEVAYGREEALSRWLDLDTGARLLAIVTTGPDGLREHTPGGNRVPVIAKLVQADEDTVRRGGAGQQQRSARRDGGPHLSMLRSRLALIHDLRRFIRPLGRGCHTFRMEIPAVEVARRWLTDQGVRQVREGWVSDEEPDALLTANEVAHSWAGEVFAEDLDAAEQLRLAFGLLDLLDDYWVTCEIRFAHASAAGPLPAGVLWGGYRRRLEADRDVEAVTYSLWVDWFEDRTTSATAFDEVLGNDIDHVVAERSEARLRRARRVLECSGPVPWPVKERTYRTAGRLPALHVALFRALRASFHDVYGDLEPAAALALLERLELPADTPHRAELRHVLAAGHRNHYRSPHAWDEAVRACS